MLKWGEKETGEKESDKSPLHKKMRSFDAFLFLAITTGGISVKAFSACLLTTHVRSTKQGDT